MANDRTVTGNEAQFNEKVIFLKDVEIAGNLISNEEINKTDLEVDNLTVNNSLYSNGNFLAIGAGNTFTKRLDVGIGGTLFTAINYDDRSPNHTGSVGIGTTQPDGLFQVGNECLTVIVNPCRVGIGTTQPDARLQVNSRFDSLNVTSGGNVGLGTTQPSAKFQLGLGNTSLSITGFGSVGLGITDPLATFHLNGNNSDVTIVSGLSTDTLRVGIGTTMPWSTPLTSAQREDGINLIDDAANGPLRLSVDGSIAISRNIYDSAGSPGANNWWLRRDQTGIRWVAVEPERSDGIYIQDEGNYIPVVGAAASFSTLNFVQENSQGIGTDTLIPTLGNGTKAFTGDISDGSSIISTVSGTFPDVDDLITLISGNQNVTLTGTVKVTNVDTVNSEITLDTAFGGSGSATGASFLGNSNAYGSAGLSTIFTKDLWGFTGTGNEASIYRMTKVGIGMNAPTYDLDITGNLHATKDVQFDDTLTVEKVVNFNDVTEAQASNDGGALTVDGGTGIVGKLFVGKETKVESATGAISSGAAAALQVVGGVAIGEKLYIGDDTKVEKNTTSTSPESGALQVVGGVGIQENLYVKELVRFQKNQTSTNSSTGALVVTGGVGIGENLNIAGVTRVEDNTQSNAKDEGALQVEGGAGIKGNVYVGDNVDIEDNLKVNQTSEFVGFATFGNDIGVAGVSTFVGFSTFLSNINVGGGSTTVGVATFLNEVGIGGSIIVAGLSTFIGVSTFGNDVYVKENVVVAGFSTFIGVSTFKDAVGIGSTLTLESHIEDINDDIGVGAAKTDWRLSSVGAGVSWRPSGVQTKRTIWVTKSGNDNNSGLLEGDAKETIGAAAAIAEETDTIKVRPGVYFENNPVGLRTDVSITGEDLRLVTVIPNNPTKDVFHVRNGCLIENLNFAGQTIHTSHLGAGAVAFPPDTLADIANTGYISLGPFKVPGNKRYKSPYVRNCTNFMCESIGMKIDGSHATAATFGQDLKSMVCDSFTQYNEAGIGVSLTNNAYAQLVSIFTINSDIAIYADSGGQCDLTNSNSSFGNYGLVAVGLGSTQFTGIVSNTNPAGDIIGSTNAGEQDTVVCSNVLDEIGNPRRPFDGQALFFKINLDNYPDVQGNGILEEPLTQLESIKLNDGVDLSGFSAIDPPSVIIRDIDGIQDPKGPQGIIAEATATVDAQGNLTEIDVIAQGRNYLPTQNIVVSIEGDTSLATAVMNPIYYTVDAATDVVNGVGSGNKTGLTTITFNEFIPYELFPGDEFSLKRISRILTSSHSFEYVGTGTDINRSTPLQGAIPIKANEIVATDGAQIPFTSTDQKGNFDIGEGIQIDQTTSTIRGRDFSRAIQAEVTPLILALR